MIAIALAAGVAACGSTPLPPWTPVARPTPPPPAASPVSPASEAAAPAVVPAPVPVAPPPLAAPKSVAPVPAAVESEAVAARFPDPVGRYNTPAFDPDHPGFTSNAELRAIVHRLSSGSVSSGAPALIDLGASQEGVPLEALHFSRAPAGAPHPVIALIGQQHGDEPAGAEALLVIAQGLMPGGSLDALLDHIDVVILPRANPDGAAANRRATASGIDLNRDQLLLRTPEAQAQAQLMRQFNPVVVVDAHEFAALGRQAEKFGAAARFDALIQYAMVPNMPSLVTRAAEEWFRQPMRQALKNEGLASEWYYTGSPDPKDKKLAMGSVHPDNARNVNGLRNAVSLLVETRGADLGRTHLLRRVHTQVIAIDSVLKGTAARAEDLRKLRRFTEADVASKACRGELIVDAAPTPSEYTLPMLDLRTGAERSVSVTWDSALALVTVTRRTRPCGYWLSAEQSDAATRLRALGVQVQQLDEAGEIRGEEYLASAAAPGAKGASGEARADLADGVAKRIKASAAPVLIDAAAGSYYVGMDQPLANLIAAALEPDTLGSYAANGVFTSLRDEARVLRRPSMKMSTLP